jgi:DNA-binding GntR family transcriptional regulator
MMDDAGAVLADRAAGAVPQSIVDQVAARVLSMILSNEITPGQPVSIQELCAALDVSNIPVREALRRLEGRGLVEFRRGRKPRIASINTADFDDVYRLRALLEGQIAQRSAEQMTPARLAALAETLDDFERIITRGNAFDVYSTHSRFHLLMLPAATEWDRRLLDQLWVASERYIQLYIGARPQPDVADTIVAAHRALLDVARGRDADATARAIVDHIHHSHKTIAPTVREAAGQQ